MSGCGGQRHSLSVNWGGRSDTARGGAGGAGCRDATRQAPTLTEGGVRCRDGGGWGMAATASTRLTWLVMAVRA